MNSHRPVSHSALQPAVRAALLASLPALACLAYLPMAAHAQPRPTPAATLPGPVPATLAYERTGRITTTIVAHALFNLTATLFVLGGVNL